MGEEQNRIMDKFMWRLFSFTIGAVLIVASLVGLSGCGHKTAEEQQVNKQLKLYFVNNDFIETGDESKGALVEYDDISIYLPEKTPKGMTDEEAASYAYTEAITHLWEVPEALKNADTLVTEKYGMHNITCKDGTAYVDLIGEDLKGSGGSFEETVFISQIVETLINSFDEVKRVQFLIDGKEAETLMGHCDTTEPFTGSLFQK
ncbi:MAG: GerMN domain-containing protein [Aminipila sp.]